MDESFNLECLQTHNELRSLHKSPPLRLSIQLAEDSQISSDSIARKIKQIKKKSACMFGENKSFSNYKQSGEEITLKWYQEIFDYKFGQERQNLAAICHFAQIVWKETTEVGFGRSKSNDGQWIVIARYSKQGNIVGKFINNVQQTIIGWDIYPIIIKLKSMDFKEFSSPMSSNLGDNLINSESKNIESVNSPYVNNIQYTSEKINKKDETYITNKGLNLNAYYSPKLQENDLVKHTSVPVDENKEMETLHRMESIHDHIFSSNENKVLNYLEQNEEKRLKPIIGKRDFVDKHPNYNVRIVSSEPSSVYSNDFKLNKNTDDNIQFPNFITENCVIKSTSNQLMKTVNEPIISNEASLKDQNEIDFEKHKNDKILKNIQNSIQNVENSNPDSCEDLLVIKSNEYPERNSFQNFCLNSLNDDKNSLKIENDSEILDNQLGKFTRGTESKNPYSTENIKDKATKSNEADDKTIIKTNKSNFNKEPIEPIDQETTGSSISNLNGKPGVILNREEDNFEENIIEFRNEILRAHNGYRSLNKVKALNTNMELTNMAQKWADHISKTNQLGYSKWIYKDVEVGENIVIQLKGSLSDFIRKMVKNWNSEMENFHYDIEPLNVDNIGHFSQVVWAETKEIGIGISTMSNFSVIVCFYFPPGNTKGGFTKNIRPINTV